MSTLSVGSMVGPYAVEGVLGAGGFGITYRCRDLSGRLVAIKELFPRDVVHRVESEVIVTSYEDRNVYRDLLLKFIEEGILLRDRLQHHGIVKVRELFSRNETAYIVMDYIDGPTLGDYTSGRTILPEEFRSIFEAILGALSAVHDAGILHRDLSLSNVLIYGRDGQPAPVLIDFGASGTQTFARRRDSSMIIANKGFAPPEQLALDGIERIHGPFTDLFAVGAMMYTVIRGSRPADAIARSVRRPDPYEPLASVPTITRVFPTQWLRAIDAALALDAEERPQSVQEFRRRLGWAVAEETTLRISKPVSRSGWINLLSIAIGAAVGVAGTAFYLGQTRESRAPATTVSVRAIEPKIDAAPQSDIAGRILGELNRIGCLVNGAGGADASLQKGLLEASGALRTSLSLDDISLQILEKQSPGACDRNKEPKTPLTNKSFSLLEPASPKGLPNPAPANVLPYSEKTYGVPEPRSKPESQVLPFAPPPQRAVFLEEGVGSSGGNVLSVGVVRWEVSRESEQAKVWNPVVLRGQVEIPSRGFQLRILARQYADKRVAARHIINLDVQAQGRVALKLPGWIMKESEQARGDALQGTSSQIAGPLFYYALPSKETDRNIRLIQSRDWIDMPIQFTDGKRGILTLETGGATARLIQAWETRQ